MAGASPIAARALPKGAPILDNGVSIALAPALSELRTARNSIEVISILETTPEHLHIPIADAMSKGSLFDVHTVRTVLQVIGFPKLARGLGQDRARALVRRFF